MSIQQKCSVEKCIKARHYSNGLCPMHYQRLKNTGTTDKTRNHSHHGLIDSREYSIHTNMLSRCYNIKVDAYSQYGGRGITVCDRWRNSFVNFYEDMGVCPAGMTLDRIDNDKGYSKDNCRWATDQEQATNRSRRKDNSSGYTGVYAADAKYIAQVRLNGVMNYLGRFNTKEEAAIARDQFYIDNYDSKVTLNLS